MNTQHTYHYPQFVGRIKRKPEQPTQPLTPAEQRAQDLYLRALARRARNSEGFGG